ncbi:hypothetical protein [Capnocytophaga haemolytica]|jgi:hypothetical protein
MDVDYFSSEQKPFVSFEEQEQPNPNNVFGVVGFVLSIMLLPISMVLGILSTVGIERDAVDMAGGIIVLICWFLGTIFSSIGLSKQPRTLAVVGLCFSVLMFVVIILVSIFSEHI